jgi:hypothetical protein
MAGGTTVADASRPSLNRKVMNSISCTIRKDQETRYALVFPSEGKEISRT